MRRSNRCVPSLWISLMVIVLVGVSTHAVSAGDLKLSNSIAQDEFEHAVRDLGVGFSYTPVETPEPKGITGFQAGLAVSGFKVDDGAQYMKNAFSDSDAPSFAVLPKIYLSKGLPLNFDLEAFIAGRPGGSARLAGGAVKWAYWEGSTASPSIGLRIHGTKLFGVDRLDMRTVGADLSISKGFAFVTPYAGYSLFDIKGEAQSASYPRLSSRSHSTTESKIFIGSRFSLGVLNTVAEVDFGEVNSFSLRANIGF